MKKMTQWERAMHFFSRTVEVGECWEWVGAKARARRAYCRVDGRTMPVARWLLQCKGGEVVIHSCDNPACIRPEHIRVGTQSENIKDAVRKGRITSLPPEAVRDIYSRRESIAASATTHNTSKTTVKKIRRGEHTHAASN